MTTEGQPSEPTAVAGTNEQKEEGDVSADASVEQDPSKENTENTIEAVIESSAPAASDPTEQQASAVGDSKGNEADYRIL